MLFFSLALLDTKDEHGPGSFSRRESVQPSQESGMDQPQEVWSCNIILYARLRIYSKQSIRDSDGVSATLTLLSLLCLWFSVVLFVFCEDAKDIIALGVERRQDRLSVYKLDAESPLLSWENGLDS